MTTATRPIRIEAIPDIGDDSEAMRQIVEGLREATCSYPVVMANDHPAAVAWDRLVDDAIDEVAPYFAALLATAVRKRLPWTWEPE